MFSLCLQRSIIAATNLVRTAGPVKTTTVFTGVSAHQDIVDTTALRVKISIFQLIRSKLQKQHECQYNCNDVLVCMNNVK